MVGICCNTSSLLRRPIFRGYVSFREGISGQIIATFSRRLVTPNDGSIGVFHPKYPNNSGLGIKFILPRYVSMLDVQYTMYTQQVQADQIIFLVEANPSHGSSKRPSWPLFGPLDLQFIDVLWNMDRNMTFGTDWSSHHSDKSPWKWFQKWEVEVA